MPRFEGEPQPIDEYLEGQFKLREERDSLVGDAEEAVTEAGRSHSTYTEDQQAHREALDKIAELSDGVQRISKELANNQRAKLGLPPVEEKPTVEEEQSEDVES